MQTFYSAVSAHLVATIFGSLFASSSNFFKACVKSQKSAFLLSIITQFYDSKNAFEFKATVKRNRHTNEGNYACRHELRIQHVHELKNYVRQSYVAYMLFLQHKQLG